MAGIIAGSVAAGWSPIERSGSRDHSQTPRASSSHRPPREEIELEVGPILTEEPKEMGGSAEPDVPRLAVPEPSKKPAES